MDGEERTYVCDDVRYEYSEKSQMLFIWLFNDDTKYKKPNHFAKYDFGRSADDTGKKVKLYKGLYREPFRDGWKYTVNGKVHHYFINTVLRYANYGWRIDEEGNRVPFTNLRHNRKALGIHYLFERYIFHLNHPSRWQWGFGDNGLVPYFPTPKSYKGYNPRRYLLTSGQTDYEWTHPSK